MRRDHITLRWLALVAVALVAACASGAQPSEDSGPAQAGERNSALTIRVDNNRPGATTVVVHITPETGIRQQLGEVDAAGTGAFEYRGQPGLYRLVAVGRDGQEVQSEGFRLFGNSTAVRWNMQTNRVLVSGS